MYPPYSPERGGWGVNAGAAETILTVPFRFFISLLTQIPDHKTNFSRKAIPPLACCLPSLFMHKTWVLSHSFPIKFAKNSYRISETPQTESKTYGSLMCLIFFFFFKVGVLCCNLSWRKKKMCFFVHINSVFLSIKLLCFLCIFFKNYQSIEQQQAEN